jgi:hypothetical protein
LSQPIYSSLDPSDHLRDDSPRAATSCLGGVMKYPLLVWALSRIQVPHYAAAASAGITESRFSRCLSGRADFSAEEMERLVHLLGYPHYWLFQEVVPPETGANHSKPNTGCHAEQNSADKTD